MRACALSYSRAASSPVTSRRMLPDGPPQPASAAAKRTAPPNTDVRRGRSAPIGGLPAGPGARDVLLELLLAVPDDLMALHVEELQVRLIEDDRLAAFLVHDLVQRAAQHE